GDMSIVDAMSNDYVNLDGWRLLKHDTQRFLFCLGGGVVNGCTTNGPAVLSKTTVALETWYHVAAVKSGNVLAIYVNGKRETMSPLGRFRNSNSNELRIGSYLLQGAYLNGLVDEVMLFDRGLTPAEVQSIHESTQEGACRFEPAASAASAR
ncbi:MAG: LamG domain-containing protein, partial [Candidatus Acidiferrales bacterium]